MDTATINKLNTKIKSMEQIIKIKISQFISEIMTYVVILGITGCGKSSLTCCMSNKKAKISESHGKKACLKGDGIVSGCKSGTKEPSIVVDQSSKLIFCDCPGFDDTEGFIQEIVNSFIIDRLFNMSLNSKFKILLVISASQIESYRGQCVLSSINRMKNMFPNLNELEKAIGLVITKGEKELTGIDYIEQLKEKSDSELLKWCNFFTSNPDRVFVFPEASKNDIGKIYDFDDHNRLLSFLQSNQITNPSHKISLSENATLYLKNIQNCINQETKNICRNIFYKICDDYRKESISKEIDKWVKIMNQLNGLAINSVDDLREFFNKKIPNNSDYNQFFEKLNESKDLNDFICNALGESKRASNLIKSIKELAGEAISELNQNYEKAKIYEEQERKRIEYEKLMEIKRKEEERKKKEEEILRKQIEKQKEEEERQKKKVALLQKISSLHGLMGFWIEEGWPNNAEAVRQHIISLQRQVDSL